MVTSGYRPVMNLFSDVCLELYISEGKKKHVCRTENFIHSLVDKYGKHAVYTDDGCT